MSKEPTRQPHADLIIMQANDMSLKFDYKDKRTGEWRLCIESPCEFSPNWEYRLHEREFPKTNLSGTDLRQIWFDIEICTKTEDALLIVANAAIKQYILDTEKESK